MGKTSSDTGLDLLDRLPARSFFNKPTGSILGILATVGFLAVALAMFIPLAHNILAGDFITYSVELYKLSDTTIHSPSDLQMALVFEEKASGRPADHSLINQQLKVQAFWGSNEGYRQKYGAMRPCESDYFANAINPIQLTDCFIFPEDTLLEYQIQRTFKSNFGVQLTFDCRDPFGCSYWGESQTRELKTNLFQSALEVYNIILYFSVKTLQNNGFFQPEVFKLEASLYSTPLTISALFRGQMHMVESSVEHSVLPWRNARGKKSFRWLGLKKGQVVARGSYADRIDWSMIPSFYQSYIHRYYRKIDWMFAVIGGGCFLLYILFWLPCHFFNQQIAQRQLAAELLIDVEEFSHRDNLKAVSVPWSHLFTQFIPCNPPNPHMQAIKRQSDIVLNIKKLKVAERNLKERKIQPYDKVRQIDYEIEKSSDIPLLDFNSVNESREGLDSSQQASSLTSQEKDAAHRLHLHRDVASSIKYQPQKMAYLACSPSLLIFGLSTKTSDSGETDSKRQEIVERCQEFSQMKNFSQQPSPPERNRLEWVKQKAIKYFRRCDLFGVKPSFKASPGNTSVVGCFLTIVILGLSFMTLGVTLSHWDEKVLIMTQHQVDPEEMGFQRRTGDGFRPAFCTDYSGAQIISNNQVDFYFYTMSDGKKTRINAIQMEYGEQHLLGISEQDELYYISIHYCFRMPDGVQIQMGGIGTQDEAYWGIQVTHKCQGTPSSCQDSAFLDDLVVSRFFQYNNNRIILPNNQYLPTVGNISQTSPVQVDLLGGIRASTDRHKEETLYVDETQLRDSYTRRFLGQESPVVQEGITVGRTQSKPFTKTIYGARNAYTLKIRPSGHVIDIYVTTIGIDTIIAMIGGTIFFWYVVVHLLAKAYNHLNVKLVLADKLYSEEMYDETTTVAKCCHLTRMPLCLVPTCCSCRQTIEKLRFYHHKMGYDLSFRDVLKDVDTAWRMSVSGMPTSAIKDVALIYLKQTVNKPFEDEIKVVRQDDGADKSDGYLGEEFAVSEDEDLTSKQSQSAIVNQLNVLPEQDLAIAMQDDLQFQKKQWMNKIEKVPAFDKYRSESNSKFSQKAAWFDIFHSNPSFSLKGQWRVRSCFGTCCLILMVILCGVIFGYYVSGYDMNRNARVGYYQYMESTLSEMPLNIEQMRIGVGFHRNGESFFQNVTSFIHPGSDIKVSLYKETLIDNGTDIALVSTEYELTPCPEDFFEGYSTPHRDNSYDFNLTYGFCVDGADLLLSHSNNRSDYFKIKVENRTSFYYSLYSFTSTYYISVLLAVPIPNTDDHSFSYEVRPIRPQSSTAYYPTQTNITLAKMTMTFPSSTGEETTISTYNYLQNTVFQRQETVNAWSDPETVTILFSYGGVVESYHVRETSTAQLFGLAGGVILFFYMILGCFAEGFNRFKMRYEVGRELYRMSREYREEEEDSRDTRQKKLKRLEVKDADYWQIQLILAHLLSFIGAVVRNYSFNDTLYHVHTLQTYADTELNLYLFMSRLRQVKDTLNQEYTMGHNRSVPITSLYSPGIVSSHTVTDTPAQLEQISRQEIKQQGMSVQEEWKWRKAEEEGILLQDIYSFEYVRKNVMTRICLAPTARQVIGQEEKLDKEVPQPKRGNERYEEIEYYRRIETPFGQTPRNEQVGQEQRERIDESHRKLQPQQTIAARIPFPQDEATPEETHKINYSIEKEEEGRKESMSGDKQSRPAEEEFDMIGKEVSDKPKQEQNSGKASSGDAIQKNFDMIDGVQDSQEQAQSSQAE